MCGIYGIADFTRPDASLAAVLDSMGSVIEHRGPDDQGHYLGRGIGLGMRRLSIIDLSGGHQPISNEDKSVWVVLNGEIYNFKDLRRRLEGKGHQFRTRTDTEVIVHLYEDEGFDFLKHLRGMFAVALWDAKHERLLLGRDRIGEKPLYVRHESGRLLFGSEMKSILQVEGVPRRLNFVGLQEYLALGYVPAPLTLLEGIVKLLPGHCLIFEKGRLEDRAYWDVPLGKVEACSEEEWICRLQEKLLETVQSQLVSDVPLGAFLSGGLDSSAIVAVMARLSSRPVKTYSIGYDGPHTYYNELPYAKIVADRFGTDHNEIVVQPEIARLLPRLIWHLDEPIADSACLTTYLVSKLARDSVTVILSGVGGDELFGGYRRYLGDSVHRWYRMIPAPIRGRWLRALISHVPQDRHTAWKDYARYLAAFAKTAEEDPVTRYMSYVTLLSPEAQKELFRGVAEHDESGTAIPGGTLRRYFDHSEGAESVDRIIYADLKTSLPDDLLALTDRMSMAASIECRAPLVDFELIELASRIPASLKVRNMKLKYIFKKAVGPWLPKEVVERKKRGFGAPVGAWLRRELQPLVGELLSKEQVERRGIFRWTTVEQILAAHQNERSDHTDQIFALIALETWFRIYMDGGDREMTPHVVGRYADVH
jgi:asparagine synthase (glutamine-hydrolysing)